MKLLVSNVGSTSLKFKLFDMPEERVLCEAKIERVGSRDAAIMSYRSHLSGARFSAEGLCIPSYAEGIALFLEKLTGDETGVIKGVEEISAIGFKTVLSRGYYGVHELTDEVMENMREYLYIAPVHNAAYIEAIGQFRAVLPDVPMIGVFETAFHREIPLERALYSIPYEWYEKYGIRKMGYHGASHGYIAQQAAKLGKAERVISCHLGGSCSICAILDGKSVDNSFGFSLQTGVMHANRAGDIDPYIVPFLMSKGMELDDILHGLSKNGGLLGVSGVSNDLREVSAAAADGNARAELAINMFVCSIVRFIGAYYAELGGLDQLVFTGGIGENSDLVRSRVCAQIRHLGVELDEEKNSGCREGTISGAASAVRVSVIPANAELGVARQTYGYIEKMEG